MTRTFYIDVLLVGYLVIGTIISYVLSNYDFDDKFRQILEITFYLLFFSLLMNQFICIVITLYVNWNLRRHFNKRPICFFEVCHAETKMTDLCLYCNKIVEVLTGLRNRFSLFIGFITLM